MLSAEVYKGEIYGVTILRGPFDLPVTPSPRIPLTNQIGEVVGYAENIRVDQRGRVVCDMHLKINAPEPVEIETAT